MNKLKRCIISAIQLFIGVRKLFATLVFMGVTLALLWLKQVSGSEFIDCNKEVFIAFMATNVAEHIAKTISQWGKKKNG